jgi:hypothetical protein
MTKLHIWQKCYHIKSSITHFLFDIESRRACKTARRIESDETRKSKKSETWRLGTGFLILRIVVCEDVESLQFLPWALYLHLFSPQLGLSAGDNVAKDKRLLTAGMTDISWKARWAFQLRASYTGWWLCGHNYFLHSSRRGENTCRQKEKGLKICRECMMFHQTLSRSVSRGF